MVIKIIYSLIYSFTATMFLEYILVKPCYMKQKNVFKSVLMVNLLTNPLVVYIINIYIIFVSNDTAILILFLEICVVIVEGFVYSKLLNTTKIKAYTVSLIANTTAYFIGLLIYMNI